MNIQNNYISRILKVDLQFCSFKYHLYYFSLIYSSQNSVAVIQVLAGADMPSYKN